MLARAIGDPDVKVNRNAAEVEFFVYYEEDDTFEVMPYSRFKSEHGLRNGTKVMVFWRPSFSKENNGKDQHQPHS